MIGGGGEVVRGVFVCLFGGRMAWWRGDYCLGGVGGSIEGVGAVGPGMEMWLDGMWLARGCEVLVVVWCGNKWVDGVMGPVIWSYGHRLNTEGLL